MNRRWFWTEIGEDADGKLYAIFSSNCNDEISMPSTRKMTFHIISMCVVRSLWNREHDEPRSLQLIQLSCHSPSVADFIQTYEYELTCNTYNYNMKTYRHTRVLCVRIPTNKNDARDQLTNRNPTNPSPNKMIANHQTNKPIHFYSSASLHSSIRMGPTDAYCSTMPKSNVMLCVCVCVMRHMVCGG